MLSIRRLTPADKRKVFPMVRTFYRSDAVEHEMPLAVLERTFDVAASGVASISGWVLEDDGVMAGFAYLTEYFSSETGETLDLQDLFILPEHREKGIGKLFIEWMLHSFPHVRRFSLEVTPQNMRAAALYRRIGFRDLSYHEMAFDREEFLGKP